MIKPAAVTLEAGPEKLSGLILRITAVGIQVELEKILFPVGTTFMAHMQLGSTVLAERVRSVKHYDRFFRGPTPKRGANIDAKMLCELHFQNISEASKMAIAKFLMFQHEEMRNQASRKK